MDEDLSRRLTELEAKLDAVYASAEKTRKYLFWSGVVAILLIVVPLLILPALIPAFLGSVSIPSGY